jgi:RNA polymerase sigma factor (sigma-70 family)
MHDSEVVAAIVAGDPRGLAVAYDRYADPLYKYCRTLLPDPADAADAVQDTFVIAASRLDRLREPDRLRAWLYAVARNEGLRILRSKRGAVALEAVALEAAGDVTDDSADIGHDAEQADLRALLEDAAEGLNPGEREVIELQLRQGLDPGEVATVLGVSRNHANALLSRARDQLGTCLAALLVGRAGRADCGELDALLTGWDGRLTVLLRKRVHRHIEQCSVCGARRAFELRPAMLLDLSPAAALAAGAELSLRLAASLPEGLRAHTLAVATGDGAGAAAHRAAVLSRAGAFGHSGFPKAVHGGAGALAAHGGRAGAAKGGAARGLRSQAAMAAAAGVAVIAVVIAAVAFALTGNSGTAKPAAAPKPPMVSAAAIASPAASQTRARPTAHPTSAAPSKTAPTKTPASSATPGASTATPSTATATTPAGPTASSSATTPSPAPTTASPAPSPTPSSPAARPTPTPGTLSEYPQGGTAARPRPLVVVPNGAGAQIDLSGSGSGDWDVDWSVSVANDLGGAVSVSPAQAGTMTASQATVTLTVTADQFILCGSPLAPTITIEPGGAVYSVCTSLLRH